MDVEEHAKSGTLTKPLLGRCLCGAVEYQVPDDFKYAGYCHCSECRRFSGSIMSAFGGIPKADFKVSKGADNISHYRKSEKSLMGFCKTCGSSLYADKPLIGMVHLRLGTLDEAPSVTPQAHVYAGSKVPWYDIRDELVVFDEAPPPRS